MRSWRGGFGAALVAVSALVLSAAPVRAATNAYPDGGGQFNGGAEGWQATAASCDVPTLCTARGGYDGEHGSPSGSLAATTEIALGLLSRFGSTVTLQSSDFKVAEGGGATLHLERQFEAGSLVDLAPRLSYTVRLIDRTAEKSSTAIAGSVEDDSGWSGEAGAAAVAAGHTYAIAITARTVSTVAGSGLLAGATSARFDNVALTVSPGPAGGQSPRGGRVSGGDPGGGEIGNARLATVAAAAVAGPAQLKGRHLFVRARCPKSIGRACRLSLLGLIAKHKPATAKRTTKVAKGKAKRLGMKVKPRLRGKVTGRKRLLFKVRVRVGKAEATAYKRLRLIRR